MPVFTTADGFAVHYCDDCFADAWEQPEAALLLHGNAESGEAWNAWLPLLGRQLRVVRLDMRGFWLCYRILGSSALSVQDIAERTDLTN